MRGAPLFFLISAVSFVIWALARIIGKKPSLSQTGVDVWKIQDVAEDLVTPITDFPIRIDRDALTLGYAAV
jgi:hypothetical protein